MQDQYVANFADYQKYALLRALKAESGLRIGICWMKTPDGVQLGHNPYRYLSDADQWGQHDPDLFEALSAIKIGRRQPATDDIERLPCMAGFSFFKEPMPARDADRALYMKAAQDALSEAELFFLDPNTGVNMFSGKATAGKANHYLTLDEAAEFYAAGRSLLIYQAYPPRGGVIADEQKRAAALATQCPGASVMVFAKHRFAFYLVIHPNHQPKLGDAARRIGETFDEEMLKLRTIWPEVGA